MRHFGQKLSRRSLTKQRGQNLRLQVSHQERMASALPVSCPTVSRRRYFRKQVLERRHRGPKVSKPGFLLQPVELFMDKSRQGFSLRANVTCMDRENRAGMRDLLLVDQNTRCQNPRLNIMCSQQIAKVFGHYGFSFRAVRQTDPYSRSFCFFVRATHWWPEALPKAKPTSVWSSPVASRLLKPDEDSLLLLGQ
jgi:hypothetical protein